MSTENPTEPTAHERPASQILIAALILAAANYALSVGLAYAFQAFYNFSAFSNFQFYNLAILAVGFVYNPVLVFLVFYKLGHRISIQTAPEHFRILAYSFIGGLIGWSAGFLGFALYESVALGFNAVGPYMDWFVWSAQLTLDVVRGGIETAFVAYTGVMVGRLRSGFSQPTGATVESEVSVSGTGGPA